MEAKPKEPTTANSYQYRSVLVFDFVLREYIEARYLVPPMKAKKKAKKKK